MDFNLIMTDDEKRQRFKNFFKKKDEKDKQKQLAKEMAFRAATRLTTIPRPIFPK